ncbi:MAG: hypothetical protein HZA32_21380 [Opitutae bacterium]|nr:hypothetical protein [Opitutae bacterium]
MHSCTTPEEAILLLEDAYRKKDIDAAVAAKDFQIEARLLLERIRREKNEPAVAPSLIHQTAHVLELSFRDHHARKGFPDMTGVVSTFPTKEEVEPGICAVTELCTWPDGESVTQKILVAKTERGWKVLNPQR